MKRRIYVVGLDPYVVGEASGETPYREYPAEWVVNALQASGYRVLSARRFANRYRETWVNGQLDMAARRLAKLPDSSLAAAMGLWVETMRGRSLDLCLRHGGLAHGHDYVIAAEASA